MKLTTLVALVGLAVLAVAPAHAAPGQSSPPPDFVDRFVIGQSAQAPDFVDRFVVGQSQQPPDFVDRFVAGHGVQPLDSADRYAAGRVVHPPDFVDRIVARELAETKLTATAPASSPDDGRTIPPAALVGTAALILAGLAVMLRRRVPQPA
jgi:hypothetical protein